MKKYYNDYRLNNENEEVQLEAVKQNGCSILFINNPSEKVQLEAVKEDGYSIQYIDNPSEKVQLKIIKQNGVYIKYINNPSEEIQLEAVKNNILAIRYIKDKDNILNKYYNYDLYKYLDDLYYPFTEEFKESDNYKKYLLEKHV